MGLVLSVVGCDLLRKEERSRNWSIQRRESRDISKKTFKNLTIVQVGLVLRAGTFKFHSHQTPKRRYSRIAPIILHNATYNLRELSQKRNF